MENNTTLADKLPTQSDIHLWFIHDEGKLKMNL